MQSRAAALSPTSDEFRRVNYLLNLSVSSGAVEDVNIWHLSNNQAIRFEKTIQSKSIKTILPVWYNAKHLGDVNSLDKIHKRGFAFPGNGKGMVFTTGNLSVPTAGKDQFSFNESPQGQFIDESSVGNTTHRFLLCQLGVGRAFVVDDPSELGNEGQLIPEGYDSLYLALSQSQGDGSSYRHDYCVTDPAQVLPMYFVQFVINPSRAGMTDDQRFAYDAHELNYTMDDPDTSITSSSLDGPMTPNIQKLYDRYDFFDPVLYTPVSVRDKMVGSHASGDLAQHKLIGIDEAYEAAVQESSKGDPLLNARIAEIRKQLSLIDGKLEEVNQNSAKVEEQIYQTLQEALFSLQDSTQSKMSALLTEEVELRRQLQQAEWIESFLDDQREAASKVDFLTGWKCHVQLRGDMCRLPLRTPTVLNSIHADLELMGSLQLRSKSEMSPEDRTFVEARRTSVEKKVSQQQNDAVPRSNPQRPVGAGIPSESFNYADEEEYNLPNMTSPSPANAQPQLSQIWETAAQQLQQQMQMSAQLGQISPIRSTNLGQQSPPKPPEPAPPVAAQKVVQERTPRNLSQYSLHAEALRRMRQMDTDGKKAFEIAEDAFKGSKLLKPPALSDLREWEEENEMPKEDSDSEEDTPKARRKRIAKKTKRLPPKVFSDAHALFMCLPFSSNKILPKMKLLYATWRQGTPRTVEAMIDAMPFEEIEYEDEDGNDAIERVAADISTVIIIKANDKIFGGFATEPWRSDGSTFGTPRCFLFSNTLDVKVPFHGRTTLPYLQRKTSENDDESVMSQDRLPSFGVLKSDNNGLQFGVKDLMISSSFALCSSTLEYSFGCGLQKGSKEAKTLLAGAESFKVEELEMWALTEEKVSKKRR